LRRHKKITLPDVLASLELERYEVELDRDTAEKAAGRLTACGGGVIYPTRRYAGE
jgi:hypothetical protein